MSKAALLELKKRGYRLTKGRRAILETFKNAQSPLTALEIEDVLTQNKTRLNKTSIYREIEKLKNEKFILAVDFGDGIKRYELSSSEHHHHLICLKCAKVQDVQIEEGLEQETKRIKEKTGFTVTRHSLEFFGLCRMCR